MEVVVEREHCSIVRKRREGVLGEEEEDHFWGKMIK